MERPYYPFTKNFQVIKQDFNVYLVAMDIVQMNYIRVIFFDPFDELYRRFVASKSGGIQ